jgi:restriction endonuclease Mrr
VTLKLMLEVAAMDDFTNLQQQKDRPELLDAAKDANSKLRKWTEEYSSLVEAKDRLRSEQEAEEARFESRRSFERVLAEQKAAFLALHAEIDEQHRGKRFESLLNELFHLFDLNPRRSFTLSGEQIDGAFTYSTDDYLLEAKWEKDPAARRDVDVLAEVVRRKSKNTLGLFVAVSGFSKPAIDAHSNCGSALVFMDGSDLYSVLDGQIPLSDVLEAKRRHLSETGLPLYLVRDMHLGG